MSAEDRVTQLAVDHGNAVLNYLRRRCDPREDAADIFQAVLLTTWRKIDSAPVGDHAATWMIGIARNELSNHRRASQRRLAATERLQVELMHEPTSSTDGNDWVRGAIQTLPARDREVIQLTYWEGLTSDEIAVVTERTSAAVRKSLQRARTKLAAMLAAAPEQGGGVPVARPNSTVKVH